jgi:putative copper resistance protein D
VEAVLVVVHLLAAAVWVGGTVALVFVGVPVVRTLEGEARARAMKLLGQRWRPLGYGALFVLGVTGVPLATREWNSGKTFHWVLIAKIVLALLLVGVSYLHNFVLGPRVAEEMRQGTRRSYRRLVVVGWISLALTLAVPVLGVVLARLAE